MRSTLPETRVPKIPGLRLLQTLGEGGMGRVYLAEDETLGRRTAVKVISERFASDPDARQRFLREARAMATVEHPHVVRIYTFGEANGAAYLVMEYVEGDVLSLRLTREGRLSASEALRITRQAVDALEAAWEKRLVHRDIKPSNILLDQRGQVRVADFGLAKSAHAPGDASLTASGSIVGTPYYVSPEQARGLPVDFRSDIYSLGIVLFEMLAGARPFEGTTPLDIVAKHLNEPLPPLSQRRPDLPSAVVQLVALMTAKNPKSRPASYAALRAEVDSALDAASRTAAKLVAIEPSRPFDGRRGWRSWAPGVGALALLIVLWFGWRALDKTGSAPGGLRLTVAVAPFYGPEEDSVKEGRVMAALVEKAIRQRLPVNEAQVLSVDETKHPVRDHAAARALGERLGANLVVWGEVFILHGETEIQPSFTLVPPKAETIGAVPAARDLLAELSGRGAGALLVAAQAPNQIELRKTSAAGVSDLVLLLTGVHALYNEDKPEKALKLFSQAPRSPQMLRCRAEALLQLQKADEARRALEDAVALDSKDAQSWASLGDLNLETDRVTEAIGAYRRAAAAGGYYSTRRGVLFEDKLYQSETYLSLKPKTPGERLDSGYLVAIDLETNRVRERHRLAGPLQSLRPTSEGLEVTALDGHGVEMAEDVTIVSGGHTARPLSLGVGLLHRRRGGDAGEALAANFNVHNAFSPLGFTPGGKRNDVPKTFVELEAALKRARDRDPTQPWHLFYLGQAAFWQQRVAEAGSFWTEMLAGEYPATPYYEYAWMAASFEQYGQATWADRAFEAALQRRQNLRQPVGATTLLERLVNTQIGSTILARRSTARVEGADLVERDHVWLVRVRALGLCSEGDDFAAASWENYYRTRGDMAKAEEEARALVAARGDKLNFTQYCARWDYLQQIQLAASGTFFTILLTLWLAARRRSRAASAASRLLGWVSVSERRALAAAAAVALASFVPLALQMRRIESLASMPVGIGDALDSRAMIRMLEDRLAASPSDSGRFVVGVANHLAGNIDRARELYEQLADDPRALKNLDALKSGSRVPPEPVRASDLAAHVLSTPFPRWVSALWEVRSMQVATGLPAQPAVLVALLNCLLALPLALGCLLVPPRSDIPATPVSGWSPQVLPGTGDLVGGAPLRGWVVVLAAFLVLSSVGVHGAANWGKEVPAAGILTAAEQPGLLRGFPLPPHPSRWVLYRVYADGAYFWGLVAAVSLLAISLHVAGRCRGRTGTSAGFSLGTDKPARTDSTPPQLPVVTRS